MKVVMSISSTNNVRLNVCDIHKLYKEARLYVSGTYNIAYIPIAI